jgi:hypothetical protein
VANYLQNMLKRMGWRRRSRAEPLPNSRPNDPLTIGSRPETEDEKAGREERQRELTQEADRDAEEEAERKASSPPYQP